MVKVGNKAPLFTLADGAGKKVKLADFKGKKVVLYFYPKDMTPGCTTEARAFSTRSNREPTARRSLTCSRSDPARRRDSISSDFRAGRVL